MSLIFDLDELKRKCESMSNKAKSQQLTYYNLINGIVKISQAHRIAKSYAISDELRELLNSVGVTIIQGTGAYKYDEIPKTLIGRTIDDTWQETERK